jgi:hypothetical protein
MRPFVVWYGRENGTRTHFTARGGDLVYLVSLVCLVRSVGERNKPDKLAWPPSPHTTLPHHLQSDETVSTVAVNLATTDC